MCRHTGSLQSSIIQIRTLTIQRRQQSNSKRSVRHTTFCPTRRRGSSMTSMAKRASRYASRHSVFLLVIPGPAGTMCTTFLFIYHVITCNFWADCIQQACVHIASYGSDNFSYASSIVLNLAHPHQASRFTGVIAATLHRHQAANIHRCVYRWAGLHLQDLARMVHHSVVGTIPMPETIFSIYIIKPFAACLLHSSIPTVPSCLLAPQRSVTHCTVAARQ